MKKRVPIWGRASFLLFVTTLTESFVKLEVKLAGSSIEFSILVSRHGEPESQSLVRMHVV